MKGCRALLDGDPPIDDASNSLALSHHKGDGVKVPADGKELTGKGSRHLAGIVPSGLPVLVGANGIAGPGGVKDFQWAAQTRTARFQGPPAQATMEEGAAAAAGRIASDTSAPVQSMKIGLVMALGIQSRT